MTSLELGPGHKQGLYYYIIMYFFIFISLHGKLADLLLGGPASCGSARGQFSCPGPDLRTAGGCSGALQFPA